MKKVTSNKKSKDSDINKMSSDIKKIKERVKKKLGMGLSSLLSKDEELASVIKNKVQDQVKSSS